MKRQKYHRDIVKSQIGTKILHKYVKTTEAYKNQTDVDKQKEQLDGLFEQLCTFVMMRRCDQTKYGSLMKNLAMEYSLNHDDYPKTMTVQTDVLANYPFDKEYYERKQKQQERDHNRQEREKEKKKDDENGTQLAQQDRYRCHCCGSEEHPLKECPFRKTRDKKEWFVTKAMARMSKAQNEQSNGNGNDDNDENHSQQSSNSSNNNKSVRQVDQEVDWCGLQCIRDDNKTPFVFKQSNKHNNFALMRNVFILDSGSTIGATVMNSDLVSNICSSSKPTIMSTNAGTKVLGTNADVPGFRVAKYDPIHMANIFGFLHMADKYRITYDNSIDNCFNVHTNKGSSQIQLQQSFVYVRTLQRVLISGGKMQTT